MKNLIIVLLIVFCTNQMIAQKRTSKNIDDLRQQIHQTNSKKEIYQALNYKISSLKKTKKENYSKEFKLKNERDVLNMYKTIIEARKIGKLPQDIWNNLNVGEILNGSINTDGSINIDGYIGNMPMPGGGNFDLGGFGDFGGGRGNNSYANNKDGKNNGKGDINNPTGNLGNNGFNGVPGQGHDTSGGTWNVDVTHSSSSHSDGSSTTSHISHSSSVSSDSGYHSETQTDHYNNGDGTWVTTKTVSQTQPDGSNATCNQTTTKDEDGTVTTTTTVTKKDSDGNVTSQKTTEKTKKEEDSTENPMDDYENGNPPPGPIEMEMAAYNAVQSNSLAGGNSGDANDPRGETNTNSDGNGTIQINDGSQQGYIETKVKGGEIKKNTKKINIINPGRTNLKTVKNSIKK